MNSNKIFTRSKKYVSHVNLKEPMYQELGLGSWLGENSGNLISTVGGALSTAIGTGLIATGIGAAPGAALAANGIGMMGKGLTGFGKTAIDNKNEKSQSLLQDQQTKLNYMGTLENRLNNLQYAGNGGFIDYKNGPKHNESGKGILVDQQGNSVANSKQPPVALTERGEITYVFPDGRSLVMSEKLGTVEKFNKIKNRYKVRLGKDLDGNDPIAKGGLLKDMNNLAVWQESQQPKPKTVEGLPMAENGISLEDYSQNPNLNNIFGTLGIPSMNDYNTGSSTYASSPNATLDYINSFNPRFNGNINKNLGPINLTGYTGKTTSSVGSTPINKIASINSNPITDADTSSLDDEILNNFAQPKTVLPQFDNNNTSESTLYNPVTASLLPTAIQGISTIAGNLAMSKYMKKPTEYSPSQIQAPSVSYEAERQSARRQATIARNSGFSALRNTGVSRGGFAAGAAGITSGVQGNLNDSLSKSYQTEENTNKQLKMSADQTNAQSKNYANMFNAQRMDQFNASKLPFYAGAIGGIQGMTSDIQSANQMKNYLGINSTRTGYQIVKDPRTGKLKMEPIKGFFERYNQF